MALTCGGSSQNRNQHSPGIKGQPVSHVETILISHELHLNFELQKETGRHGHTISRKKPQ